MVTLKVQGLLTKASKSSLVLPFILHPKSNLSVIVDCPVFKICLSLDDCWLFCLFCFDRSWCCMIYFLLANELDVPFFNLMISSQLTTNMIPKSSHIPSLYRTNVCSSHKPKSKPGGFSAECGPLFCI